MEAITKNSSVLNRFGESVDFSVTYRIPIHAEYFGRWSSQCIALTKQGSVCMTSPTEYSLAGLCNRHFGLNLDAGGSRIVFPAISGN